MTSLRQAAFALDRLILYRELLSDPLVTLWRRLAVSEGSGAVATYCELLGRLYAWEEAPEVVNCNLWQTYFLALVGAADNIFTRAVHTGEVEAGNIPEGLQKAARHDLECLEMVFMCPLVLMPDQNDELPLPPKLVPTLTPNSDAGSTPLIGWLAATRGWARKWSEFLVALKLTDTSIFRYPVLQFRQAELCGVAHPDPVRLVDLFGFVEQREAVVNNTARFAARLPAHNLLLYGDRGAGKSATVKAATAEFAAEGLRLVEVDCTDLHLLPQLLEQLRSRPYRFVIFIDDLAFAEGDPALRHLKVLLEGTVQSVPENVILYATSNRRHLVAESVADRKTAVRPDDIIQERLALADRFGRTVIFTAPDQDEYLSIVAGMAAKAGIDMPEDQLRQRATTWATWQNGRSARTAKQFITELLGSS